MKPIVLFTAIALFMGFSSLKGEKKSTPTPLVNAINNSITGIVLDGSTGESLTGVEVRVEGTEMKTYTDFDGKFVFEGVKPGNYKISTNYISYKCSETQDLSVKNNQLHALNIELVPVTK